MKLFMNGQVIASAFCKEKQEAFVVDRQGRILEIGKNEDLREKYPHAERTDLEGKTVLPGLNDSHLHFYQYALGKTKVDLSGAASIADIQATIKEYIDARLGGHGASRERWIECNGWNDENFEQPVFPGRDDLDRISREVPILCKRVCFHVAVANSRVIELCGIDENTPDPKGGEIGRDEKGQPNGIFYDEAIEIIERNIPKKSMEEIKEILEQAFPDVLACGLTSMQVDEFLNVEDREKVLRAYRELREEERIPLRICLQLRLPKAALIDDYRQRGLVSGFGDEFLKIGPVKFVLDGSLGARTAALKQAYSDKPDSSGKLSYRQEDFNRICRHAAEQGYQIAVHAIGDRALEMVLNGFEYSYAGRGESREKRPVIVHAQISSRELIARMREQGVIAAIQPIFVKSDWDIVEKRVGKERGATSYAWKTYYNEGIKLSGSSDAPIEPFNPFLGIYTAVCRQDLDGRPSGGWHPEEKLTPREALSIFTEGGAYQSFEENIKGSLAQGKLADFVVIDRDITEIDPAEIKDTKVLATYVGGEAVYTKNSSG